MNDVAQTKVKGDAARKRWEYLRKKGAAYTATGTCGFVSSAGFAVGAVALLCFIGAVLGSVATHYMIRFAILTVIGLVAGALGFFGAWYGKTKADVIPYVPPVREQIAALPAKEILVRGSDQPAATPWELLRAVQAGTATGAEELLRSNCLPTRAGKIADS